MKIKLLLAILISMLFCGCMMPYGYPYTVPPPHPMLPPPVFFGPPPPHPMPPPPHPMFCPPPYMWFYFP